MLNLKEEQRYERLKKLAWELHLPIPEAFLTLEVFDKNGKLLQRHHQRSHSWVRNAYNLLLTNLAGKNLDDGTFGPGLLSIKATSGTIRDGAYGAGAGPYNIDLESEGRGYRAAAASNTQGIQVGSGTNAESFEDYMLQTLIAEGTGAGQLNYVLSEVPTKGYAALTQTITHIRYMNNNSGGDVSINEVGLILYGFAGGVVTEKFMTSRDKLGATVTVPDTGQVKVTYTVQLTYPS